MLARWFFLIFPFACLKLKSSCDFPNLMHPFWQIFDAFFWVCKGVDWDEQRASSPLQGMLSAQILGVVYNNQHWNALCSNVQNTLLFAKCDWVLGLGDWDVESLTNDCQSQVRGQIYIVQKQKTGLRAILNDKRLWLSVCHVMWCNQCNPYLKNHFYSQRFIW